MNEKKNTFQESRKNDKVLRRLLVDELKRDKIIHVVDVGDDKVFMPADIDLLIVNKDYRISSVEAKADNYGTTAGVKKIFIETISNDKKFAISGGIEGMGNARYSKSDYFLYYFIKLQSYLIIPTKQLQAWITVNLPKGKYEIKTAKTCGLDGKVLYNSYGMLVPINVLIDEAGAKLFDAQCKWEDYINPAG